MQSAQKSLEFSAKTGYSKVIFTLQFWNPDFGNLEKRIGWQVKERLPQIAFAPRKRGGQLKPRPVRVWLLWRCSMATSVSFFGSLKIFWSKLFYRFLNALFPFTLFYLRSAWFSQAVLLTQRWLPKQKSWCKLPAVRCSVANGSLAAPSQREDQERERFAIPKA